MATSKAELKTKFLAFCDTVKKGSTTATDKTLKKICTDCKIYTKGFDANRVDIEFRGHIGNAKRDTDFVGFLQFVEGRMAKAYGNATGVDQEAAAAALKEKIMNGSVAQHGTTKPSNDSTTARLTDVKGFTGASKERFDSSTSKGKGSNA